MPSSAQPPQAAQKPRIWFALSSVRDFEGGAPLSTIDTDLRAKKTRLRLLAANWPARSRADSNRHASPPALPQRDRQVAPSLHRPGIQSQRLLPLIDRFVQLALQGERGAQAAVRVDGIRQQPQRRAELIGRIRELTAIEEEAGQIVARHTVVRVELHRLAQVRD